MTGNCLASAGVPEGHNKVHGESWSDLETGSWCNRKELLLLQTEESSQGDTHDAHRSRTTQAPAPHLVWQAPSSAPYWRSLARTQLAKHKSPAQPPKAELGWTGLELRNHSLITGMSTDSESTFQQDPQRSPCTSN